MGQIRYTIYVSVSNGVSTWLEMIVVKVDLITLEFSSVKNKVSYTLQADNCASELQSTPQLLVVACSSSGVLEVIQVNEKKGELKYLFENGGAPFSPSWQIMDHQFEPTSLFIAQLEIFLTYPNSIKVSQLEIILSQSV